MRPRGIGGPPRRDIWASISRAVTLELDCSEASASAHVSSPGVYWHRASAIAGEGSWAATERTSLWESGTCAKALDSESSSASAKRNRLLCFIFTLSPLSGNVLAGAVLASRGNQRLALVHRGRGVRAAIDGLAVDKGIDESPDTGADSAEQGREDDYVRNSPRAAAAAVGRAQNHAGARADL